MEEECKRLRMQRDSMEKQVMESMKKVDDYEVRFFDRKLTHNFCQNIWQGNKEVMRCCLGCIKDMG